MELTHLGAQAIKLENQVQRLAFRPARLALFNKSRHALTSLIAQHAVGKTSGSKIESIGARHPPRFKHNAFGNRISAGGTEAKLLEDGVAVSLKVVAVRSDKMRNTVVHRLAPCELCTRKQQATRMSESTRSVTKGAI